LHGRRTAEKASGSTAFPFGRIPGAFAPHGNIRQPIAWSLQRSRLSPGTQYSQTYAVVSLPMRNYWIEVLRKKKDDRGVAGNSVVMCLEIISGACKSERIVPAY
jgi:hypothetical protein